MAEDPTETTDAQPSNGDTGDTDNAVVDNLVTQFSSPLHCFRELVQNSIDAGSPTIDVWTEFVEGDGHEGTIALHVDDYGEGMDEHIIDQELTRLFASSKEKDLTKIGQFGIGFVSTFALDPEAILVETGRSGEYWEVLFHEDRSFTKKKLEVPVEGTQITIFLSGDVHRYNDLVEGIEKTLHHWCSHSDTEVTFEDRTPVDGSAPERIRINDPFEVDGECQTSISHEGTEIVAAYSDNPIYGFYNRGLTLARSKAGDEVLGDQRAARFGHIAFKIKSRYLEHTLSRETVMRDDNYEKAMQLLEEAADGPLFDNLVGELEALASEPEWSLGELDDYRHLCTFLTAEPTHALLDIDERPLLRRADGRTSSLSEAFDAWRRDGRVMVADEHSELADQLLSDGIPVLLGGFTPHADLEKTSGPVNSLLTSYIQTRHQSSLSSRVRSSLKQNIAAVTSWLTGSDDEYDAPDRSAERPVTTPESVYLPVVLDDEIPDDIAPLIDAAGSLLDSINAGYNELATCTLGAPDDDPPLFVFSRRLSSVMARPPRNQMLADPSRRPHAAVNRDHPHFREVADLWNRDPQMAAYFLAKSLLLTGDRLLDADARLMDAARDHQP
jgi:hypothetical protein